TVTFSHGTHALPAPAVAELVQGLLVHGRHAAGKETVTPTGAALIRALARAQGPMPAMRVIGHGRGAGQRDDPGLANLLRIFLGERSCATGAGASAVLPAGAAAAQEPLPSESLLVAATVDDMSPQLFPAAFEQLFAAGAVDVHVTPVLMKKSRPGHLIEVLCTPQEEAAVVEALLRHTTTLGCRIVPVRKLALARRERIVQTSYGAVPVKEALLRGEVVRQRPEYEVVAALARQHGVPLEQIVAAVQAAL
ncbi:MAG: LarC family nickel insertion protein, partial [Deltaproteobacteria bacterium]|nr:LarC family nickel insertion protein [Deltaproteobacteria bacterium]